MRAACADCGDPIPAAVVIDWGKYGPACGRCAQAWWGERNRYRQPFGVWLLEQRERDDAAGHFARFCDASALNPAEDVPALLRQLADLQAADDVQDAALDSQSEWLERGWVVPSR